MGARPRGYDREHIMRFTWLAAVAAFAFVGPGPGADEIKPAVVYDLGGKFDKSFNEAAYNGAERFKEGNRNRVPRFRDPERFAARAGAPQLRPGRPQPDRRRSASAGSLRSKEVATEFPGHPVRHHRLGRRPAERPLDRLQGGRRLLPRRHPRGDGVEARQGRLRRRHGYPADPQIRLRLCAGREVGRSRTSRSSRT